MRQKKVNWVDVVGGRGKLARAANWFQSEARGTLSSNYKGY